MTGIKITIVKHKVFSKDRNLTGAPAGGASPARIDLEACPEEVARRAYFTYVNEGAPEGRAVQHWLDAEAELIRERNLTRVHGFHNKT